MSGRRAPPTKWELRQIAAVLLYLYGAHVEPLLESRTVEVERSPTTGRIRHVYVDGKLAMTLRSSDGFLVLTPEGWRLLRASNQPVGYAVETTQDVAEFVSQGRNLFSKHVVKADPNIIPGDDVCIVAQPTGSVIAVGRAVLPGEEMGRLKRGKAVKTRKGVKEGET
ncbi:MAG: PUA domain-containing protein [Thermofilum sp.]